MILDLHDLCFSYEKTRVLNNITVSFNRGKIYGIIGPNGSGKTTLLRCINRILEPEGKVSYGETDLAYLQRKKLAAMIGFVPQKESIDFPFTVLDILKMGRYHSMKPFSEMTGEDFRMIDYVSDLLDLETFLDRNINEISGGEFQKVIIARALIQEPVIILMDEPTLHLDPGHQLELLDIVKKVTRDKDMISIMVSHDLYMAGRFFDELIIMNHGTVHSVGKPIDVLTKKTIREIYNVDVDIIHEQNDDSIIIVPKKLCS